MVRLDLTLAPPTPSRRPLTVVGLLILLHWDIGIGFLLSQLIDYSAVFGLE